MQICWSLPQGNHKTYLQCQLKGKAMTACFLTAGRHCFSLQLALKAFTPVPLHCCVRNDGNDEMNYDGKADIV